MDDVGGLFEAQQRIECFECGEPAYLGYYDHSQLGRLDLVQCTNRDCLEGRRGPREHDVGS